MWQRSILVFCVASTLAAASRRVEETSTETVPFAAGGSIEITKSFGELHVEGWNRPEVEITVIKAINGQESPKERARALQRLSRVRVTVTKRADDRLVVSSVIPFRMRLELKYRIKVPRETRLSITHDIGEVKVADVVGDIHATARIGQISLRLPESEQYEIDARSRIGAVDSAFQGRSSRPFLLGEKVFSSPAGRARRLYLRVGIGEIEIQKLSTTV